MFKLEEHNYIEKISIVDIAFIGIFIFGVYSGVFFYFTQTIFLPFGICALVFPYFFVKTINELRLKELYLISLILIITFIGLFVTPYPAKFFVERLKGLIHLAYTLTVIYITFLFFRRYSPLIIARIFGIVALILLIGTFMENFVPGFREISDHFRFYFFKQNLYVADQRDIELFGNIRPRLFTQEPSHIAKFFILSMFIWFSLTTYKKKYWLLIIGSLVGLYLIMSPIIILLFFLVFFTEIVLIRKIRIANELKHFFLTGKLKIILFRLVIILSIFVFLLLIALQTVLAKRFEQIMSGQDLSFLMRVFAPPLISLEVISKYPLFGVGITAKELLLNIITHIFKRFGFIIYDLDAVTNAFWLFIIYYGIGGVLLFIVIQNKFLNAINIRTKIFVIGSVLIFSQAMGGFVSIRWWFIVFMIFLIAYYRDNHQLYSKFSN